METKRESFEKNESNLRNQVFIHEVSMGRKLQADSPVVGDIIQRLERTYDKVKSGKIKIDNFSHTDLIIRNMEELLLVHELRRRKVNEKQTKGLALIKKLINGK